VLVAGALAPHVTLKSTTDSSVTLLIDKSKCTQQRQGFTYKFNVSYASGTLCRLIAFSD